MSSRTILSCSPLQLLAVGVVLFGAWIAYDGVRGTSRPSPEPTPTVWEPGGRPDQRIIAVRGRPALHVGMPRGVAECVLAPSVPEAGEVADAVDGVPVRRVSYQVNLPRGPFRPSAGWHRVTVDFASHPDGRQVIHRLSAVAIPEPHTSADSDETD